jgi:hypothetical protein
VAPRRELKLKPWRGLLDEELESFLLDRMESARFLGRKGMISSCAKANNRMAIVCRRSVDPNRCFIGKGK